MEIRTTTENDLAAVLQIYAQAREFMRKNGNPTQWTDSYPPQEMIERDISEGKSHVCVDNGEVVAVFYYNIERDPTYEEIDGNWINDEPCGVIHRIAKQSGAKGAGAYCINWCFDQCGNIKIDTHRDNIVMRKLLNKLGFTYCGAIRVQDGEERIAFQKAQ